MFHFHVHDIDPAAWKEHLPLGTNFVEYKRILTKLDEIGYKGYLIFEIGGKPELMEGYLRGSKKRLEAMLGRHS